MRYILTLIFCLFTTVAWATRHEVIVKIRVPETTFGAQGRAEIQSAQLGIMTLLRGTRYTIKRRYSRLPYLAMRCSDAALIRLAMSSEVLDIASDEEFFLNLRQSIPLIGASKVHTDGFLGQGYTVSILDTGVDKAHLAFGRRVVAEACFTDANQCPNGTDTQIGPGAGVPCAHAQCYHGTHVAGIAAGSSGVVTGVAPRANLVSMQIFTVRAGGGLSSSFSDIMAAIEHTAVLARTGMKIAAINMSLGTGPIVGDCTSSYQGIDDAVALAKAAGVGTIAAAGNNGSLTGISSPGCIRSIVAVGSTTKSDSISSFSNRGPEMDLWAPGSSITSASPRNTTRNLSGTSMSAPHVAGAYALIHSMFPGQLTPDDIRTMVKSFGTDVVGRPRLRVDNVQAPGPPPPDPNDPTPPPPECADSDGDGEQDSRDRCPNTPAGEPVDDAGCSHEQWCNLIVPDTWRSKGECRMLDWKNDETRLSRDCTVRRLRGRSNECVPRV